MKIFNNQNESRVFKSILINNPSNNIKFEVNSQ